MAHYITGQLGSHNRDSLSVARESQLLTAVRNQVLLTHSTRQ